MFDFEKKGQIDNTIIRNTTCAGKYQKFFALNPIVILSITFLSQVITIYEHDL